MANKSLLSLTVTVPEEGQGRKLRDFMRRREQISGKLWKRMKWQGRIRVNGMLVKNANYLLSAGDVILCEWPEESEIISSHKPLSILYEDASFLVVNKPAGMIIHPTGRERTDTLVNRLAGYFERQHMVAGIHPVYRLDRDTTGVVIVAKSAKGQYALAKSHDCIYRAYIACAAGTVKEETGRIDAPIGRRDGSIVEWEVRGDGKRAVTDYTVIGRERGRTWLSIHLLTGRTHQIRVHLAYMGHPLLGDSLYGEESDAISRQALHAYAARFTHPETGVDMKVTAPIPADMLSLAGETVTNLLRSL
ncbi:MAG: RluA family pseudouridine synthase [Dialister sp.]|nr:RluA family pseudouridine synthase [Dialister sp.]